MIRRPSCFLLELVLPGLTVSFVITAFIASRHLQWNEWQAAAIENQALSRAIDIERERSVREIAHKRSIIERYTVGDVMLLEAAGAFLAIDTRNPVVLCGVRATFVGGCDLEREARCVVRQANFRIDDPIVKAFLTARMKNDFRALFPDSAEITFSESHPPIQFNSPTTNSSVAWMPRNGKNQ